MAKVKPLRVEALYRECDPESLGFQTTAELEVLEEVLGQRRALDAVHFGFGIRREGYNIFALGPSGTGKKTLLERISREVAKGSKIPPDICYVNNFEKSHEPTILCLPAGKGRQIRDDMKDLVGKLRYGLTTAFEHEKVQGRRQAIESAFKQKPEKLLNELQKQVSKHGVSLMETPMGLMFAPVKDDELMPPDEFSKLPKKKREKIEKTIEENQKKLQQIMHQLPRWNRERREEIEKMEEEIALDAISPFFEKIEKSYARYPRVLTYIESVKKEVLGHVQEFIEKDESEHGLGQLMEGSLPAALRASALRRFEVNVLVEHGDAEGAPVVFEDNPTYQNLMGRVEHTSQMGSLMTDFHLIRPGAIHKANGGVLLLEARELLRQPYAWDGLKRTLRSGQVRMESLGQALGLISAVSLEPEPLELDVKVILFGERIYYYLLCHYDQEFGELFKVEADFEEAMPRTAKTQKEYARLLATLCQNAGLRSFDRKAVARVIEQASRWADDADKLSLRLGGVEDLLEEADYWAKERRHSVVRESDVRKALEAREDRGNRVRERLREQVLEGTVLIDSSGEEVGRINGLAVIRLGKHTFGRVSRITAQTWLGRSGVIDVERKVDLGGPLHTKGVLILTSFLSARYGAHNPISLSASLVFEQSYGGIDGDSASFAECCVLLSAIGKVPLRQDLGVTGSLSQHGMVQAIGGVNEKIEGFFDLCLSRGLTGEQGVIIPQANVKNLMLRKDLLEAVKNKKFNIYPIADIDQGIELLTGLKVGNRLKSGGYPKGSFNQKVEDELKRMSEKLKPPTKEKASKGKGKSSSSD